MEKIIQKNRIVQEVEVEMYKSKYGKVFDNEEDCLKHEQTIDKIERIEKSFKRKNFDLCNESEVTLVWIKSYEDLKVYHDFYKNTYEMRFFEINQAYIPNWFYIEELEDSEGDTSGVHYEKFSIDGLKKTVADIEAHISQRYTFSLTKKEV